MTVIRASISAFHRGREYRWLSVPITLPDVLLIYILVHHLRHQVLNETGSAKHV